MSNHLAGESSPYLLQHKDNPVDWYPWSVEALERAREEDKPIFLSIGYSACHWCHVMERESFTDAETAALLNENFISIKVDREERPDLDDVYMQAVTALTGNGGWPLSVWLTPEGLPFYGGTYFPPATRYGRPSFKQVLASIADLWRNQRWKLEDAAANIQAHLSRDTASQKVKTSWVDRASTAATMLAESVDPDHGGWGDAPKFPQTPALEFLLANQALQPQPQVEMALRLTLNAMAAGGMYDQLGGGFHRYSTDRLWLVPHFEKMLYDNAQLARCYLHAWQLFGDQRHRRVSEETLDYLCNRMRHPRGGFFSAEDADSEGKEGAFYTWTLGQVEAVLPPPDVAFATRAYGLTEHGQLDGANVLHEARVAPGDRVRLHEVRTKLLKAREQRVHPARDEKILAGWNGLALAALSETAVSLGVERYAAAATETAEFIVDVLIDADRRLIRSWKDGRVSGQAFLTDYAAVADGLLALYAATFDERWFVTARALMDTVLEHFRRPAGGFFDTSDEHERLVTRPRSLHDGPTASGNSMTAAVLTRIAAYTGQTRYADVAEETIDSAPALLGQAPVMFGQWLLAGLLAEKGPVQVAVVGELSHPAFEALLAPLRSPYRPDIVLAARPAGDATMIPMLQDREPPHGTPVAAWVCRHSTCSPPTGDPRRLTRLIDPAA